MVSDPATTDQYSTLGLMMAPPQYGMHHYGSPPSYTQNYPPASQHGYVEHRSTTSGPYEASYVSSPALSHEQRRPESHSVLPPYQAQSQPLARSPYQQQQPLGSMRSNSTPLAPNVQGYSYSMPHGNLQSQPVSSYPPYVVAGMLVLTFAHMYQTTAISASNIWCQRLPTLADHVSSLIDNTGCIPIIRVLFRDFSATTSRNSTFITISRLARQCRDATCSKLPTKATVLGTRL
jgi:hypothetical protein